MPASETEFVPDLPTFGRYQTRAELGAGGMGTVYRASDLTLQRDVAIKTLAAARGDDEIRRRFFHEARAIGALSHPNILAVYDMGVAEDLPYLVLELAAHGSLAHRLRRGPVEIALVRAAGIQIAQALAAAHARGIVHRDVKPANVLETEPGVFKLADFGIAHLPDSDLTVAGAFLGSPAYAAPEALRGVFTPASDVFGLGATLHELLAGPRPDPRRPRTRDELRDAPADLAAAVMTALAPEPTHRPSAAELARQLAGATTVRTSAPMPLATATSTIPVATMIEGPTLSTRPAPRRRWIAAAVALGVAALIALIVATSGDDPEVAAPTEPQPALAPAPPDAADDDAAEDDAWEDDAWEDEGPPPHAKHKRGKGKGKGKKHKGKGRR